MKFLMKAKKSGKIQAISIFWNKAKLSVATSCKWSIYKKAKSRPHWTFCRKSAWILARECENYCVDKSIRCLIDKYSCTITYLESDMFPYIIVLHIHKKRTSSVYRSYFWYRVLLHMTPGKGGARLSVCLYSGSFFYLW